MRILNITVASCIAYNVYVMSVLFSVHLLQQSSKARNCDNAIDYVHREINLKLNYHRKSICEICIYTNEHAILCTVATSKHPLYST